jgi:hypothetical protein
LGIAEIVACGTSMLGSYPPSLVQILLEIGQPILVRIVVLPLGEIPEVLQFPPIRKAGEIYMGKSPVFMPLSG